MGKMDWSLLIVSLESQMQAAARLVVSVILMVVFAIALPACGTNTPTLGFAPHQQLVQKAIALQISKTQQRLTQQLHSSPPKIEISQVVLKQVEPLFIEDLPTYRVLGTYNIKFDLPKQQVTRRDNPFDVYLQRQQEGKTWRLLIPQDSNQDTQSRFSSYLIR
jgi:hypothetical protein